MTRKLAIFLALALCLAPAAATAASINLYDDFPRTLQGENGLLAQYSPTETPSLLTDLSNVDDYKFALDASGAAPIVEKDMTEEAVLLTPAEGNNAVLTWKVQEAGIYLLKGRFRLMPPPDDSIPVSIRLLPPPDDSQPPPDDNREIYAVALGMGSGEAAFDLQVFLSEDWLLSFLVAPGIATSYATLLEGEVSLVPVPGSLLLLGTGLLGLGAAGWRRRRKD